MAVERLVGFFFPPPQMTLTGPWPAFQPLRPTRVTFTAAAVQSAQLAAEPSRPTRGRRVKNVVEPHPSTNHPTTAQRCTAKLETNTQTSQAPPPPATDPGSTVDSSVKRKKNERMDKWTDDALPTEGGERRRSSQR